MTTKTNKTPRKVYSRHGITHICFKGSHFASRENTQISTKFPLDRVTVITSTIIEVAQWGDKNKAEVVEIWDQVKVPRHHNSTQHGFWKSSGAWFTGWTY
jgi:hypothetical protein